MNNFRAGFLKQAQRYFASRVGRLNSKMRSSTGKYRKGRISSMVKKSQVVTIDELKKILARKKERPYIKTHIR